MLLLTMQVRILRNFLIVFIKHAFREANYVKDWMANRGHSTLNLCYWFEYYDIAFTKIIRNNALGLLLIGSLPSFLFVAKKRQKYMT